MRKLGHRFFNVGRRLREHRASRKTAHRDHAHDQSGLRRRTAPRADRGDTEAPQVMPKRLQPESMHSAGQEEYESLVTQASGVRKNELAEFREDMTLEEKQESIRDAKDNYWERKKREMGEDFDEEEVLRKFARKQLLWTNSNADLMVTADIVIDEDWLGDVEALPGNIYRLAVLGAIFVNVQGRELKYIAQAVAKMLGLLMIVLIQVVGPPAIFFSKLKSYGVLEEKAYDWHCCPWYPSSNLTSAFECNYNSTLAKDVSMFDDWSHIKVTKLLGMLMMSAFTLNGLFVVMDEKHAWNAIYSTFRYLDVLNDKFELSGMRFMYLDCLVNNWVIGWCCIDSYFVIGESESPTDVLMNALGLVFLYNLDDVGGDLGFVNEDDWPGNRFAWIYKYIVKVCPKEVFDPDKPDLVGRCLLSTYNVMSAFLAIMTVAVPALAAFTPFIQIVPND